MPPLWVCVVFDYEKPASSPVKPLLPALELLLLAQKNRHAMSRWTRLAQADFLASTHFLPKLSLLRSPDDSYCSAGDFQPGILSR